MYCVITLFRLKKENLLMYVYDVILKSNCSLSQSTMIELHHSIAAVKAEAVTRVGPMTGPEETANREATRGDLEVLGHGPGLPIWMKMLLWVTTLRTAAPSIDCKSNHLIKPVDCWTLSVDTFVKSGTCCLAPKQAVPLFKECLKNCY